jgi:hypothetical protein
MMFGFSCTDFIAHVEHENEWSTLDSANIVLYYRPENHSSKASPSMDQARYIVKSQNIYYRAIQDSLHCEYNDKVLIYLFNIDEAYDKIGTNGGGHALPKFNTYYYTFIDSNRSITDPFGIVDPYLGAHELVHVISHRCLGYPGTKLLSEGYAVWLDGTFARLHIKDLIIYYRDNAPEKILTPDQMLFNAKSIISSIYYPNCGIFTKYIVQQFGVEIINSLFNINEEDFILHFEMQTGENWEDLCAAYTLYLNNL